MLVISEPEIRQAISMPDAVDAIEAAFAAMGRGEVDLPPPLNVNVPASSGEVHVRAAHITGSRYVVIKVATGFWDNRAKGLPTGDGLMLALDATTGAPHALLVDHGFLTEMRTGAAGAIAAKYLAKPTLEKVALIGAGEQAPFQIRGLAVVRRLPRIAIWSRTRSHADQCAAELGAELGAETSVAATVEAAVRDADLIITVTPSHVPLVRAEWLTPGVHITAVGADGPTKQELSVDVLAGTDLIVADSLVQCLTLGEIHHAVAAGVIRADGIHGELGDLVLRRIPGRSSPDQTTVCDLTGLGVQDAAIAALALERLAGRDPATRSVIEEADRPTEEPEWR